jgi:hypothetical protein
MPSMLMLIRYDIKVSPLSMLKSPIVLLGIVGLGFAVGMPYILDNSTYHFPPYSADHNPASKCTLRTHTSSSGPGNARRIPKAAGEIPAGWRNVRASTDSHWRRWWRCFCRKEFRSRRVDGWLEFRWDNSDWERYWGCEEKRITRLQRPRLGWPIDYERAMMVSKV